MPPLPAALFAALSRHWGFDSLRPLQEHAIRASLDRRDSLVVMPTGGGKSLCYQLPAVVRGGLTVVVSPLIALMKDQVDGLKRIGVPAVRIDSTITQAERRAAADGIRNGTTRLVFTSPERLMNADVCKFFRDGGADTVAVDEAHCVSHWGHDFRPEYRQLAQLRDTFPGAAVHAYTATATERVRNDIAQQLGLRDPQVLVGGFDRPNLTYRVLPRTDEFAQVKEVLDRHPGDAGIVYCLRKKDVDDLAAQLKKAGYKALPYHAGMSNEDRRVTQEAFISEEIDVVVATVAFGMGIDRSNVRFVVHAAMPKTIEHYQQETGRGGRDGLPSECVLFHSGRDFFTLKSIIEKSAAEADPPPPPEYVTTSIKHLNEMSHYCNGAVCRHKALVRYFGQDLEGDNCGACDICLGDTTDVPDAATVAKKILSCVARILKTGNFGINHVIDVLRGANTENVRSRKHDQLTTYGLLKEAPKNDLRDWIYQLIGQGALAQADGDYPVLKLTPASWAVMEGKQTVRLIQQDRAKKAKKTGAAADLLAGADAELFEILRKLRKQEASRVGVASYQVFGDATLAEFARRRPSTEDAMLRVSGVGEFRMNAYGRVFLNAIRSHCLQINLPMDVPPPKAGPKVIDPPKMTGKKPLAFELFRSGTSVAAVAKRCELAPATIVEYLAEFILSEKPASIFDWVPEDVCERVAAAAEMHGTSRLKPVFMELNQEVSYDHIRVVFAFLDSR
jgi:ATP-dependent DNA helicase RecQ